jgi:cytochrome d ubiquinol oxidase subunit I
VTALDQFPREDWPPVALSFQAYHIMVALGIFFILLTVAGVFFRLRGTLFDKRWLMWIFVFSVAGPYIANQFGWVAAEVGRQPWIVYGLLRTSDAVSKSVSSVEVLVSIIMYSVIYILLFIIWIYVLDSKIKQGPDPVSELLPATGSTGAMREAVAGGAAHQSMTGGGDGTAQNRNEV